eukprot:gene55267-57557_t
MPPLMATAAAAPTPPSPPGADSACAELLRSRRECGSDDTFLGDGRTVDDCAAACANTTGCMYFISGIGDKAGRCYWEHTQSPGCPEQWDSNDYNFYRLCPASPPPANAVLEAMAYATRMTAYSLMRASPGLLAVGALVLPATPLDGSSPSLQSNATAMVSAVRRRALLCWNGSSTPGQPGCPIESAPPPPLRRPHIWWWEYALPSMPLEGADVGFRVVRADTSDYVWTSLPIADDWLDQDSGMMYKERSAHNCSNTCTSGAHGVYSTSLQWKERKWCCTDYQWTKLSPQFDHGEVVLEELVLARSADLALSLDSLTLVLLTVKLQAEGAATATGCVDDDEAASAASHGFGTDCSALLDMNGGHC